MNKQVEVKLTNNPLENIKIMAPLLNKKEQENAYVYILGLYNGTISRKNSSKKAGQEVRKVAREIQKLTEKLSGFIQENIEKNMSANNVEAMAELTKALALLVIASTYAISND